MAAKASKRFLLYLADLSLRQIRHVTRNLTPEQVKAIREVVFNLLKGNIKVDQKTLAELSPHKRFLRTVAYKGIKRCQMSKYCGTLLKVLKIAKPLLEAL